MSKTLTIERIFSSTKSSKQPNAESLSFGKLCTIRGILNNLFDCGVGYKNWISIHARFLVSKIVSI